MTILQDWRLIASTWIIVVALIFGATVVIATVQALRYVPGQTINWKGVANPVHDGAFVNRTSRPDHDER